MARKEQGTKGGRRGRRRSRSASSSWINVGTLVPNAHLPHSLTATFEICQSSEVGAGSSVLAHPSPSRHTILQRTVLTGRFTEKRGGGGVGGEEKSSTWDAPRTSVTNMEVAEMKPQARREGRVGHHFTKIRTEGESAI